MYFLNLYKYKYLNLYTYLSIYIFCIYIYTYMCVWVYHHSLSTNTSPHVALRKYYDPRGCIRAAEDSTVERADPGAAFSRAMLQVDFTSEDAEFSMGFRKFG